MSRTIILSILIVLAACAAEPVHVSSTADQVMAAQYHAIGAQGLMSGDEAGAIRQTYLRQLTANPNQTNQIIGPIR
jgi:hypothetical protein